MFIQILLFATRYHCCIDLAREVGWSELYISLVWGDLGMILILCFIVSFLIFLFFGVKLIVSLVKGYPLKFKKFFISLLIFGLAFSLLFLISMDVGNYAKKAGAVLGGKGYKINAHKYFINI
jgi:hypothetical protein